MTEKNQPIISVHDISKRYNITHQHGGYIALRDVLTNVAKKPLTFLKHKAKSLVGKTTKEIFWALKDVNFEVYQGEAIGIIGANGAGKSTLLKILTGITPPTTGEIKMEGKVASLLEVGTGFHPELTGRENIFLNGAILGMIKAEIAEKFDAIVEFSGVQKFIDTPVKRYSSGMYVRLAFSVAAHMEPDILLVDEVLAVGDTEFQKKCLGKMDEVTKTAGRTILFVSHNMSAIQNLCSRCILLEEGKVKMIGKTKEVIDKYLKHSNKNKGISKYTHDNKRDPLHNEVIELISAKLTDKTGNLKSEFEAEDEIYVSIEVEIKKNVNVLFIDSYILNDRGIVILSTTDHDNNSSDIKTRKIGKYISCYKIPKNLLNIGEYLITIGCNNPKVQQFFIARNVLSFQINSVSINNPGNSIICLPLEWSTTQIN